LGFASQDVHHQLSDEQVREVDLAKREVREGKIAGVSEMDEVWRLFDR